MKVAAFLGYTIAGTLAVLFATFGVGQWAPAASPLPAMLTGLGLLLVLAVPLWFRLRGDLSPEEATSDNEADPFWTAEARRMVARKFALVAAVLGAALLISIIAFSIVRAGASTPEALESLSFFLQLVFLAATFTAIFTTFPLAGALRDAAALSPKALQRINRVVLRAQDVELDAQEQAGALRLARLAPVILPLQNFGMAYLYASLATQLIRAALQDRGDVFSAAFLVLLIAIVAFFVPFLARQVRRARRYARKHGALIGG